MRKQEDNQCKCTFEKKRMIYRLLTRLGITFLLLVDVFLLSWIDALNISALI